MGTTRQILRAAPAVLAALVIFGACADDSENDSLNINDEMQVTVIGDCVEFDIPEFHSSACVVDVGGSIMGQPDNQWFAGFAPAGTDVVVAGDVTENRFVDFEDLKVFAVPYEPGMEIVALNSDGLSMHSYSPIDE